MSNLGSMCSDYGMTGQAIAFLAGVLATLVVEQAKKNDEWFKGMINLGLEKIPEPERSAYQSMWYGHLDNISGPLEKLVHASACCFQGPLVIAPSIWLKHLPSNCKASAERFADNLQKAASRGRSDALDIIRGLPTFLFVIAIGAALLWLLISYGVFVTAPAGLLVLAVSRYLERRP